MASYFVQAMVACTPFIINMIFACLNCRRILAAIITLLILIVADAILIVIAYKTHKLRSMSTNVITLTTIIAVPTLGTILSCLLRNPGPVDEDLSSAVRRPVGASTIAICFIGVALIFVLYFVVFYWT